MFQQESIYNLVPKAKIIPGKDASYHSKYPPTIAATASTFIKAFENIEKFSLEESESSFSAWLFSIWYHALLDLLKRSEYENLDENNVVSWNVDYVDYFQKHSLYLECLGEKLDFNSIKKG